MTNCLGCFVSTFKYYHFGNFTFSHSHENISNKRSSSFNSHSRSRSFKNSGNKRLKKYHHHNVARPSSPESFGMTSYMSSPIVPTTSRVSENDTSGAFNRRRSNNMPSLPLHGPRRPVQADLDELPPAYFDFRNNPDSDNSNNSSNNNNNNSGNSRVYSNNGIAPEINTASLPPPPTIAWRKSPAANSSKFNAERALAFTKAKPLAPNRTLTLIERHALSMGCTSLVKPPELGRNKMYCSNPSAWGMRGLTTKKGCTDACLISSTPLFSATHSPAHEFTMLAYFEVRLLALDPKKEGIESGIAIGFVAQPYPTWRMPGHERGSLGVHSDDGRRYINDSWGGRDFIDPFRVGDLMGVGMKFRPSVVDDRVRLPAYGRDAAAPPPHDFDVQVFCTRNGTVVGSWDLHEQVDAEFDQPGGLEGLEGHHDLYAAIGVFGKVDLEVRFGRKDWGFEPNS